MILKAQKDGRKSVTEGAKGIPNVAKWKHEEFQSIGLTEALVSPIHSGLLKFLQESLPLYAQSPIKLANHREGNLLGVLGKQWNSWVLSRIFLISNFLVGFL